MASLKQVWRYYDTDDSEWYPCVIAEAHEARVVVVRTNELGFEDKSRYKRVTLMSPSETVLQLA